MVSPFSTDDTTMHKHTDPRSPNERRPTASIWALSAAALIALSPLSAEAGDKHHHRYKRGEYKEKYWDGACKVERKWKRNGDYSEKRKCRDDYAYGYAPQPAIVPMMPVAPAIVINPPPIVIRP
ncbi:hypothetical protein C2U31_09945 [Achromobacter sp. AONIH1]|nr:hypothetical protein [Achromobacter sp. AONIH1]AUT46280.1 hypothetical protein C2U31_09945 [Achromobacter sp. AONIH1]